MARPKQHEADQTDLLGTLIGLIGQDAVFKLVAAAGGTRIVVPMRATEGQKLTRILGMPAAGILSANFGKETLAIPMAKAWRVRVYRERGLSYGEIALAIGCNEATVFKHLRRMGLTRPAESGTASPAKAPALRPQSHEAAP